jgi:Tol biopolymer transport system component
MNRLSFALFAALIAAGPAMVAQQTSAQADKQLAAAHHKATVDGDLKSAIEMYQKIVAGAGANRALAAQALVRMAECHQKLGHEAESRRIYERIAREFADQPESATTARSRLGGLEQRARAMTGSGVILRRVVVGNPEKKIFVGGVSRDGRYLSYTHSGDLALLDLASETTVPLPNAGHAARGKDVESSRISSDGKRIAYVWQADGRDQIRTIGLDGSDPRLLYDNEEAGHIQLDEWSSDDRHILATFYRRDRNRQLVLISVADGSMRVVKSLEWRSPLKASLSPDGRYIVYDVPENQDAPQRDVFVLATDGSREIPFVRHPANDFVLGWAPDGSRILFASDRTGNVGAWTLDVANGSPQGSPKLVKPNLGQEIVPVGFARNGSYYFGVVGGMQSIHMATLDPTDGRVVAPPAPIGQRVMGRYTSMDWSPDGEYLAYFAQQKPVTDYFGSWALTIQSIKTGEARQFPMRFNVILGGLRWSPDGRSILIAGRNDKLRHGVFAVDVQTGVMSTLFETPDWTTAATWSADGTAVFHSTRVAAGDQRLLVRNPKTNQEEVLYRLGAPRASVLAASPNGRELAFIIAGGTDGSSVLMLMPAAGGEPRELFRGQIDPSSLAWTPAGRHLLFGIIDGSDGARRVELHRIPVAGGMPEKLSLIIDTLSSQGGDQDTGPGIRLHPDGRRLAIVKSGEFNGELWALENFLPAVNAKK